jgi:TRAP-type C4-dicarboxylate transport system substrate-binding protein
VIVLSDAWLAGAGRLQEGLHPQARRHQGPEDPFRRADVRGDVAGGRRLDRLDPSNEVYNALQTGVADATDTSTGSFVSFRIYEQVKCVTAPGDNALWFMYEPVLMSKKRFDKLDKQQQDVLLKAGKKVAGLFQPRSQGLDDAMVKVFKDHKVEVVTLTSAEYDTWVNVARQSSYAEFAKEVPDGKQLIDEALSVK